MEATVERRRSSLSISISIDELESPPPKNEEPAYVPEILPAISTSIWELQSQDSLLGVVPDGDDSPTLDHDAQVELGLRTPFIFEWQMPYSHSSLRNYLSRPKSSDKWCQKVLEQRWFQSIGNKLRISAAEFHWYADQGLEHLRLLNEACGRWYESRGLLHPSDCGCIFNADKYLLHKWAIDIMNELVMEIESEKTALEWNGNESWGLYRCLRNETWEFPCGIVPELIERLPLPYSLRRKFFDLVTEKWKEVPSDISPFPEILRNANCSKHVETADWKKKMILRHQLLQHVHRELASICREIGVAMMQHLYDEYTPREWNKIQREFDEEMENERKEAEWDALEREAREREEREAMIREEDREGKEQEEESSQVYRLPPQSWEDSDSSSSENDGDPSNPFLSTAETTRSQSPSISADEIAERLKPIKFDWGAEFDEDEEVETSTPNPTSPLPQVDAGDSESSTASSGSYPVYFNGEIWHSLPDDSIDDSADILSLTVEADESWTRSGTDIFDSGLEAETNAEQPDKILPAIILPVIKPEFLPIMDLEADELFEIGEVSPDETDDITDDSVSSENSGISDNIDCETAPEVLDIGEDPETASHDTSTTANFVEISLTQEKLESEMELLSLGQQNSLSFPLGELSQDEELETAQDELKTGVGDSSPIETAPQVSLETQENGLLFNFKEHQSSISPIASDVRIPNSLLTEAAAGVPLPDSEDENYELASTQKQDGLDQNRAIGKQSLVSIFAARAILPSGGSYSFSRPQSRSRRLAHQPTAPSNEKWCKQAMNRSRQIGSKHELKQSDSGVQRAAISFVVITMALHFSSEIIGSFKGVC